MKSNCGTNVFLGHLTHLGDALEQGKEMANSIGCFAFYEVNSLNKTGVNELFEKIIQTAIDRHT